MKEAYTARPTAKELRPDPIYIKALQISVTSGEEAMYDNWDGAHVEPTYRAAIAAYQEGRITDPRKELSLMQVHDCFSITELVTYEDLQISLFEELSRRNAWSLAEAIDGVRDRFGFGSVVVGRSIELLPKLSQTHHGYILRTPSLTK